MTIYFSVSSEGIEIIPGEKWKPVKGFENRYRVSTHGRIYSTPKRKEPRLLEPGIQSDGYLTVWLYGGSKPKRIKYFTVHRLVLEAFGPEPELGQTEIIHKDTDRSNNHIDNLEWCTPLENHQHAVATGQYWSGESNGSTKLTDLQIVEILQRLDAGEKTIAIAGKFSLNRAYVCEIRQGKYRPRARQMYAELKKEKADEDQ